MNIFVLILELVGTMAFAASGTMTGLRKNMDIFGICVLGLTTAVGGGVIRDLVLGNTPPITFQNPIYAAVSILISIILFLPQVRQILTQEQKTYDLILFVMDSLGLGIFTVMGISAAYDKIETPTLFLLIFVGVVTGVGGGVMRDMMAGDTPYIFVKHIYACASLGGALICVALWYSFGKTIAIISGTGTTLLIRSFSAYFHWNLPRTMCKS